MKYYADYYNECVYAIAPDGRGKGKCFKSFGSNNLSEWSFKAKDDSPWYVDENDGGVYFRVEPISEAEYNQFGVKWRFGSYKNLGFSTPEYWRNFVVAH